MNELALFAGAGGGIIGGHLLGFKTVCAVEIERDCQERLLERQRAGFLPFFPIWDDVRTFDGVPWRGVVDIVTGGFPCTDISAAGRGAGIEGEDSGLWREMARILGDVRPRFAWVENSPLLTSRGLDRVLGDLSSVGYDAVWGIVSSAAAGGSHRRKRIWILAHAPGARVRGISARPWTQGWNGAPDIDRCRPRSSGEAVANANGVLGASAGSDGPGAPGSRGTDDFAPGPNGGPTQPGLGGAPDGLAAWLDIFAAGHRPPVSGRGEDQFPWEPPRTVKGFKDRRARLKAIGNGQDPWALMMAFRILSARMAVNQ